MKEINKSEFDEEVLNNDKPTLVVYSAPWCGPCKGLATEVEKIDTKDLNVNIVKVDISNEPDLATKYRIRGVPTMHLFIDGQIAATKVGSLVKSELETFITSNS